MMMAIVMVMLILIELATIVLLMMIAVACRQASAPPRHQNLTGQAARLGGHPHENRCPPGQRLGSSGGRPPAAGTAAAPRQTPLRTPLGSHQVFAAPAT